MAAKPLLDSLITLAHSLRQAEKISEYQTTLDAYDQIRQMQREICDLEEELRELRRELERVQADQVSSEGRKVWAHLLWIPGDDDPYCIHCWDQRKRLFHVLKTLTTRQSGVFHCPECGSETLATFSQTYWQSNKHLGQAGDKHAI